MNPTSSLVDASLASDLLASNSPTRELLAQSIQIGAVYRLVDFDEALVITNDSFVHAATGVPRCMRFYWLFRPSSRTRQDAGLPEAPDDEEVVLLRVTGNARCRRRKTSNFCARRPDWSC